MSYTPGPWVVYDDSNDGKTNRIEIAALGKTIARIYQSVPEKDLPNAHLISAAPDLYEALQEIVDATDTGWEHLDEMFTRARAALKKARGER
jgi:uncharacterized membrane protein